MSNKKQRQQKLRDDFLKRYSDFPIEKIDNVLVLGGWLRGLKLGIVMPTYNKETEEITFNLRNTVRKNKIGIKVIKKIDCENVNISIYLNNKLYASEDSKESLAVRRINTIILAISTEGVFTNEEVLDILEKISYANSLAKQNPENKGFLYAIKHDFIRYLFLNHSSLFEYIKQTTVTGEDKLLEVKIGDFVFHVPQDHKNRYFCWDENIKPEKYVKGKTRDIPENLDIDQLNKDLFYIYLKLSSGNLRYMKSDAVRYWYTREIMKKLFVNDNANLIRVDEKASNYSAQSGIKYRLIDTKTGKQLDSDASFESYFSMAICSGLKI